MASSSEFEDRTESEILEATLLEIGEIVSWRGLPIHLYEDVKYASTALKLSMALVADENDYQNSETAPESQTHAENRTNSQTYPLLGDLLDLQPGREKIEAAIETVIGTLLQDFAGYINIGSIGLEIPDLYENVAQNGILANSDTSSLMNSLIKSWIFYIDYWIDQGVHVLGELFEKCLVLNNILSKVFEKHGIPFPALSSEPLKFYITCGSKLEQALAQRFAERSTIIPVHWDFKIPMEEDLTLLQASPLRKEGVSCIPNLTSQEIADCINIQLQGQKLVDWISQKMKEGTKQFKIDLHGGIPHFDPWMLTATTLYYLTKGHDSLEEKFW